jgi:hypothetical protein
MGAYVNVLAWCQAIGAIITTGVRERSALVRRENKKKSGIITAAQRGAL